MIVRRPVGVALLATLVCSVVGVAGYRYGRAHADGAPTTQPLYYGGVLEDGGRAVEGMRSVTVRLWDAMADGTAVCTTVAPGTSVSGGRFRVALDAACATAVQANPNLWAEVIVDSTTFARQKLGAVPYAIEAGRAAGASGALATRIAAVEAAARPRQVVVGAFTPDPGQTIATMTVPPCSSIVTTTPDTFRVMPFPGAVVRFVASNSSFYLINQVFSYPYSSTRMVISPDAPRAFSGLGGDYFSLTAGVSYTITIEYRLPTVCNPSFETTATQSRPIVVSQLN